MLFSQSLLSIGPNLHDFLRVMLDFVWIEVESGFAIETERGTGSLVIVVIYIVVAWT